jgi:hypothetical protein
MLGGEGQSFIFVPLLARSLQEKLLLRSTFVDTKTKKLLQNIYFALTFWLTYSDAIHRVA